MPILRSLAFRRKKVIILQAKPVDPPPAPPPPTVSDLRPFLTTVYGHPRFNESGVDTYSIADIAPQVSMVIGRSRSDMSETIGYRSANGTLFIGVYQLGFEAGGTFGNQRRFSGRTGPGSAEEFDALPASAFCYRDAARTIRVADEQATGQLLYLLDPADGAARTFLANSEKLHLDNWPTTLDFMFWDNFGTYHNLNKPTTDGAGTAIYPGRTSREGGNAYTHQTYFVQEKGALAHCKANVVRADGRPYLVAVNAINRSRVTATYPTAVDYASVDILFFEDIIGWPVTSGYHAASRVDQDIVLMRDFIASGPNKMVICVGQMDETGDNLANDYALAASFMGLDNLSTQLITPATGRNAYRVFYRGANERNYRRWFNLNNNTRNYGQPQSNPVRGSTGQWTRQGSNDIVNVDAGAKVGSFSQQTGASAPNIKHLSFENNALVNASTGFDTVNAGSAGTMAIEPAANMGGNYFCRWVGALNHFGREDMAAQAEVFVTFRYRMPTLTTRTAAIRIFNTRVMESLALTSVLAITLNEQQRFLMTNRGSVTGVTNNTTAMAAGTIYKVGLHFKLGTGSDAVGELFIAEDGQPFPTTPQSSLTTGTWTTGAERFEIGSQTTTAGLEFTADIDDIKFDTAAFK